jgi:hypothetical protein
VHKQELLRSIGCPVTQQKLNNMANTAQRLLNSKAVQNIMNKRKVLDAKLVGKKVSITIKGNGTQIMVTTKEGKVVESVVEPGTPFEKVIFNLGANSSIAMLNKANWALAAEGLKAEKAGDPAKAHEFFSDFLNKMQVSFSIPTTLPVLALLGDQADIEARVIRVDTENGSLLTIDPATIRVLAPVELRDTTFSFDGLLEEPKEGEDGAEGTKDGEGAGSTEGGAAEEGAKIGEIVA